MKLRRRKANRAPDYQSNLLRGSTESLLLALIGNSPQYGYSIIKEIEHRTEGGLRFRESTLYPALHRLEQDGLVKGEWASFNGMDRKYYSMTERGAEVLKRRREEWRQFSTAVNRIIGSEAR